MQKKTSKGLHNKFKLDIIKLINYGNWMANILYNLEQTGVIGPNDKKIMKDYQSKWDKASDEIQDKYFK